MNKQKLIKLFFNELEARKINYAILHGVEELPNPKSDIDFVIDKKIKPKLIQDLILDLTKGTEWKIANIIRHEISAFYFVIFNYSTYEYVKLDMYYRFQKNGLILLENEFLLSDLDKFKSYYKLNSSKESFYYLLKKIIKKDITLNLLKNTNIKSFDFYDVPYFKILLPDLIDLKTEFNVTKLSYFNKKLKRRVFFSSPIKNLFFILKNYVRNISRITHKTGFIISYLGPDGAGKSTVIGEVNSKVLSCFRNYKSFHMFNETNKNDKWVAPHAKNEYGGILSFFKFIYIIIRYIVNYFHKILPYKIKSTLITLERYYYDVIVDPKRFRIKLPKFILNLGLFFIPKPDLVIYLDATPDNILKRKQELTKEELKRQIRGYRTLVKTLNNAFIVDANQSADKVVKDCVEIIITEKEKRTLKVLK